MGPSGRNDHYVPLVYVVNPKPVVSNVTYHDLASASDGWTPDSVKLFLGNGNVIKCSFYESLGGIKTHLTGEWEGDEPTSMNFQCEPEGSVSFILVNVLIIMITILHF